MKKNRQRLIASVIIGIIATLAALLSSKTMLIDRWEKQAQDLIYRSFYREAHPEDVVIIAIDQNSLNYFQENLKLLWPWPRDVYALMTDFLSECGAKVIAFDVIFSSPDIDRLNVSADYADARFAEAMQRSGRVVLATQMEDSTHVTKSNIAGHFNIEAEYSGPEAYIHDYPNLTAPIRPFQESMVIPGAVNFFTDDDGVCRRIPLIYRYENRIIPYMALSAAMVYTGDSTLIAGENGITIHDYHIPVDKSGRAELFWYGPGGPGNTFTYVSFAQLLNSYLQIQQGLEPEIPVKTFRDKAVFIGATAAGLLDLKTTPFSPLEPYPGVEIYATLFSNIVRGEFIRHLNSGWWTVLSLLLLAGLCYVWQRFNIWKATLVTIIVFCIPVFVAIYLFQNKLCFFPVIWSEAAIIMSVIAVLIVNYLTEGREKAQVKKVFNRYLHPAVVETLTQNPETVEMGGKEIEATVVFTDLQGFTGTSELFSPHEIVEFLNDYFAQVETIIFQNNGMLDKYTGDGIMAIFGAPIESQDHAFQSCQAVIGFQKLSKMSVEKAGRVIQLITRVGMNSGRLIVGNIGSPNRMDFTAIGDTVNLAARLEGVNKIYGTQNLISETTYDMIKEKICCREIDHIRVKGRDAALKIFTIVGEIDKIDNKTQDMLSLHLNALNLYRQRDFIDANDMFEKALRLTPDDPVAPVFIRRCGQLLKNPGLIDDDGIFNITIK
ncbi:MAG: adenylate/guanylate cyclase domain-containing protein [Candidatus Marinimicrobia bacterium]|nr:adenylate/guanylate cyclase domain-containing protein [Candidatus Neomarinimicrobiota bacterium]